MSVELSTNAFLTKEEIRNYVFSMDKSDVTDEVVLYRIANGIFTAIENHCGKYFIVRTGIEEFHDGGIWRIFLNRYPVTAITEVTETGAVVGSGDYTLYKNIGVIYKPGKWARGQQNVKVTYGSGYGTQTISGGVVTAIVGVPEDVRLAALSWVRTVWKTEPENFSAQIQGGVVFRPNRIPAEVKGFLEFYRGLMAG